MISLFNKKNNKFSITGLVILAVLSCILLTNAKNDVKLTNKIVESDIKTTASSNSNGDEKKAVSFNADSISIMNIESRNFDGKIMTIPDSKKIVVGYSLKNSKINKTTSQIAKEEKAIAAINAGAFKTDLSPSGFIIKDGNIVYSQSKDEGKKHETVGFDENGQLIVGKYTLEELKDKRVKEAVEFGPALIINGKATKDSNSDWGVTARTAIGQKKNGEIVLLIINGDKAKYLGARIKEVTDILLANNVVNAALLDGGDSSTMYYKGEIVNRTSDPSGERVIPSAFIVLP